MILPKTNRLTTEQLTEITAIVAEFGCKIQPIVGAVRTIYAIVGDERDELMINRLEGLEYVDRIDRIQSPFKLMDRRSDLASGRLTLGGVTLGQELFIIAGQCTIDPKNPNYFYETAHAVKEAGAHLLRGGVWKPRTNPYTFQGDTKSLDILLEASRRTGLPVNTEVMEEEHVRLALDAGVTLLQVGARNALNYSLLRAIGRAVGERTDRAVLLKRSIHWARSTSSSPPRSTSRRSATPTFCSAPAAPVPPSTATATTPTRASPRCSRKRPGRPWWWIPRTRSARPPTSRPAPLRPSPTARTACASSRTSARATGSATIPSRPWPRRC